jgi:electron transfer flavoprotein alpha subunit
VPEPDTSDRIRPDAPLRVAVLAKQVPLTEDLELSPEGRLRRQGVVLEMNPYCRRAVAKGTELAEASGGSCTVFTLGPDSAEEVLREAVAWGADEGVHLCDPAFAGSDTLATARALAAALEREGPFDLVFAGRNTIDGDTGQVGPEVAELCDLPFAGGVRRLALEGRTLRLHLEQDDGSEDVELELPAVLTAAERLCPPCKVDEEARRAVPADRLRRVAAADLGPGPWGAEGSPTTVGAVRVLRHDRAGRVLRGDLRAQVGQAVDLLVARGALDAGEPPPSVVPTLDAATGGAPHGAAAHAGGAGPTVAVVLEDGRPQVCRELLGAARRVAGALGGEVRAWSPGEPAAGEGLADEVVVLVPDGGGDLAAEDVARAVAEWAAESTPWLVLAPSTAFGREVAGRAAAALGAGLVGDAISLDVVDGELVAAKPAFAGALVADIGCSSAVRLVTVRPGMLPLDGPPPLPPAAAGATRRRRHVVKPRRRVRTVARRRDDDVEVLARAPVVIGVGAGVSPEEYPSLSPLAAILRAELAATRKVTDKGWAPRSRQVGVTGRSISPRLYVAVGLSGKFNHMVGVRSAGTVLAINPDEAAPVFGHADIGIVGDWHDVVPLLAEALRCR